MLGGKIWARNVAQGDFLSPTDPVLLSETSVKSAAEEMIAEYGNEDPMDGYKNALNKGVFLSE